MVYRAKAGGRSSIPTSGVLADETHQFEQSGSSDELLPLSPVLDPRTHGASALAGWCFFAVVSTASISHPRPALVDALGRTDVEIVTVSELESSSWAREFGRPVSHRVPTIGSVISLVEAEPVEDGMTHPAESVMREFVKHHGASGFYDATFGAGLRDAYIADLLRLLGRVKVGNVTPYLPVLRTALASSSLEVRDAAVQVIESWERPEGATLLKEHLEHSPWLADHIARVVRDLAV
jgi:hypothetical protein